jgi:membrane protein implicated in regulation of membrane protease activity
LALPKSVDSGNLSLNKAVIQWMPLKRVRRCNGFSSSLALLAALVELHTGTFYLAAAAAAALLTALTGFWIRGDLLIFVFVLLCAILMGAVMLCRRHRARGKDLADFDIGKTVTISSVSPQGNRLMVSYRGVNWDAVMEDGSVLAPGGTAIIVRKTDKLLHLALRTEMAQT